MAERLVYIRDNLRPLADRSWIPGRGGSQDLEDDATAEVDRNGSPASPPRRPFRIGYPGGGMNWKAIIATLLVAEVVAMTAFLAVDGDGGEQTTASSNVTRASAELASPARTRATEDPAPQSKEPAPAPATRQHTNGLAGYSFSPPPGWTVKDRGATSEVTSPDGDAVATLGPVFAGPVERSSERLLDLLERSYSEVQVVRTRIMSLHGARAIVTEGSALNESDVSINYGIYVVEGRFQNFAIGVFQEGSQRGRDPGALGESIFRSFSTVGA